MELNKRSRSWCFTINNPTKDPLFKELPEICNYIIWQKEKGSENTIHFQGYIFFKSVKSLKQVKDLIDQRAHVEIARGSPQQNKEYCSKSSTKIEGPWEFGEIPIKGKRNDLKDAATQVIKSGSLKDVPVDLLVKYSSGLQKLAASIEGPYRPSLKIITIIGYTGLGKTYSIFDSYENVFRPCYGNSGLWFDGYNENEVILFDEFKGQIPLQKFLQILDPYPCKIECKGGFHWLHCTLIFITSNSMPEFWYENKEGRRSEEIQALYRRLGCPNGASFINLLTPSSLKKDRNDLMQRLYFSLADAVPAPKKGCLLRKKENDFGKYLERERPSISISRDASQSDSVVNNDNTLDGFSDEEKLLFETPGAEEVLNEDFLLDERLEALKK